MSPLNLATASAATALALVAGTSPAFAEGNAKLPEGLTSTTFAGNDITPSPACLAVAPTGEVFVGVDLNGSLGKGAGKGRIVRLVDTDNDGVADEHTIFAEIDNPRGIQPIEDRLIVLHTVIPADTGILAGLHLSELRDADGDGVADGPPVRLVSDLSPPKHNQDRGADHTTNGIRLGIDGWIYIAVGDFGIHGAVGSDGTELTMLGGGIVRVRPDGSEMEVYTHGLRNIYDVAIDPFMNLYTRGNTNDGGGWNVRFIHQVQTGEYGYPMLFKGFTDEIIPALEDVGGGSGTGAMFLDEPGWPESFNKQPLMCDWGRSQLVLHRLTPDGPSFTQVPEEFIKLSQISDVDIDASGRMFLSAWDGAGYKGSTEKGYVERVVPVGWTYRPCPEFEPRACLDLIKSESAKVRLHASQTIVNLPNAGGAAAPLLIIAQDGANSLEARVAAIFTYKQIAGAAANPELVKLAADASVREWALRAAADRKGQLDDLTTAPFVAGLQDPDLRVQVASAVALGRLGDASAAPALLAVATPPRSGDEGGGDNVPPVFVSEVLREDQTAEVDADITGFENLYLLVDGGGDGDGNDHAGWFDPVLVMADGSEQSLPTKPVSHEAGWGKGGLGKSATGADLVRVDGTASPSGIGTHSESVIIYAMPEGVARFRATVGLANTHRGGSVRFTVGAGVPEAIKPEEGPHATPNSPTVVPHVAVAALRELGAWQDCLTALDGPNRGGGLWALKAMHQPEVVDALISRAATSEGTARAEELELLARLGQREAPYDGSWWWSTRPDTHGPYYRPEPWEKTADIHRLFDDLYQGDDPQDKGLVARLNEKNRTGIENMDIPTAAVAAAAEEPTVDLAAVAAGDAGEIATTSIEDVMLSLDNLKGNVARGRELFTSQGCLACHTVDAGDAPKGPFMGQVGAILTPEQIAESILKPNASISQGFATVLVQHKGGAAMGFITAESADEVEMRDIAGQVHKIKTADITGRQEMEHSMMPPGLANSLSLQDFASLVAFLAAQKG